jgi:hypothetical protein
VCGHFFDGAGAAQTTGLCASCELDLNKKKKKKKEIAIVYVVSNCEFVMNHKTSSSDLFSTPPRLGKLGVDGWVHLLPVVPARIIWTKKINK